MEIEQVYRDASWGDLAAEMRLTATVADLAYLGAQVRQAKHIAGKEMSSASVRRIFKILAPNMRRDPGDRRNGGRPRCVRSLKRLSTEPRRMLVSMLGDYHDALLLGAEPVEARIATWRVFDAEFAIGGISIGPDVLPLDVWLLFVDHVQMRRAVVTKCGVCGAPNVVLDLGYRTCVAGGHHLVDAGPYFKRDDGSDSPILDDLRV